MDGRYTKHTVQTCNGFWWIWLKETRKHWLEVKRFIVQIWKVVAGVWGAGDPEKEQQTASKWHYPQVSLDTETVSGIKDNR